MYQEGGKKGCEAAQEVTDEWKGLSPAERFAVEFFRQPKGKIVLCKEIDGAELQIEIKGAQAGHDIAIAIQDYLGRKHLTQ